MGESYLVKANSGILNAGRRITLHFQLLHEMHVTAAKLGSSREWVFSHEGTTVHTLRGIYIFSNFVNLNMYDFKVASYIYRKYNELSFF